MKPDYSLPQDRPIGPSLIIEMSVRIMIPFIQLFSLYVIAHGHYSPGGGFQGGVALASGMVLLLLCQGHERLHRLFPVKNISLLEAAGFLAFLAAGIAGLIAGKGFLADFLPSSVFSENAIPGGGIILILNIIIGLKVGAGITLICVYLFIEEESE